MVSICACHGTSDCLLIAVLLDLSTCLLVMLFVARIVLQLNAKLEMPVEPGCFVFHLYLFLYLFWYSVHTSVAVLILLVMIH